MNAIMMVKNLFRQCEGALPPRHAGRSSRPATEQRPINRAKAAEKAQFIGRCSLARIIYTCTARKCRCVRAASAGKLHPVTRNKFLTFIIAFDVPNGQFIARLYAPPARRTQKAAVSKTHGSYHFGTEKSSRTLRLHPGPSKGCLEDSGATHLRDALHLNLHSLGRPSRTGRLR
jgi:hypothetical protein